MDWDWQSWLQVWSPRLIEAVTTMLPALDLAAACVFALTGALVASRKGMDIVGFMWLGTVTGVGGGTVRDLLLGAPVFWVKDPTPIVACLIASCAAFFTAHLVQSRYRLLVWLDAVGLALVTIAGTAKGLDLGASPVVAVVMGVITAVVGGIIRDILGHEPSIILRREIYVTASMAGAVAYVALVGLAVTRPVAALTGGLLTLVIRGLAISRGWSLPTYRTHAPRSADEVLGRKGTE
jgi:uncharacterized membrane protein YeiH